MLLSIVCSDVLIRSIYLGGWLASERNPGLQLFELRVGGRRSLAYLDQTDHHNARQAWDYVIGEVSVESTPMSK